MACACVRACLHACVLVVSPSKHHHRAAAEAVSRLVAVSPDGRIRPLGRTFSSDREGLGLDADSAGAATRCDSPGERERDMDNWWVAGWPGGLGWAGLGWAGLGWVDAVRVCGHMGLRLRVFWVSSCGIMITWKRARCPHLMPTGPWRLLLVSVAAASRPTSTAVVFLVLPPGFW
jgi:hypothetical protein